jgi:hypothetical protein
MIDANASISRHKEMQIANRGYIYEFLEKDGTHKNDVLVVSSEGRSHDKMVNIIMIGDNPSGYDIVPVNYNGQKRFVHRELVTYCWRGRLGKAIAKVSDKTMEQIDEGLLRGLGLKE